jgi:ABC-2 type transport system ATP-binding protein
LIKVENITKYYGPCKAVEDVSFTINKGEIVGFLGPNGAGKTTVLKVITGAIEPTSGRVSIFGHDIRKDPLKAKSLIGYLPENNPLYLEFTPRQYLRFIASLKGMSDTSRQIEEVMKAVFITDVKDRLILRLSKGYRQRVGLAAALLGQPEVLLLDEPTVGLDPNQIVEIRNLIKEIGKTNTILLSTHILQEVSTTCDRIIIIHNGRIAAVNTPEELGRQVRQERLIRSSVKSAPDGLREKLAGIPGIIKIETTPADDGVTVFSVWCGHETDPRPEMARRIVTSGGELIELAIQPMSLEEVFMSVTSDKEAAT